MEPQKKWDDTYTNKQNGWSWNFNSLCYWAWKLDLKNGRALDLGCGIGEKTWLIQRLGFSPVFGLDFSQVAITEARTLFPNIHYIEQNLENLASFAEKNFDIILDNKVLAFINDKEKYLATIAEKLDGIFLVDIPHIHKKPITVDRAEFLQLINKDFKIIDEKIHSSDDQVIGWYALKKR